MKRSCFVIIIVLVSVSIFAQKGTANYLSEKSGFKCFKLSDHISKYSDVIKPIKEDPGTYAVTDSSLLTIGEEIKLSHIFIKTFNDSIYSISLMAKPEYKYKIRSVLIAAFGAWTYQPNKYMERYYWMSSDRKIELLFDANNHQWCITTYKDNELDIKKGKSDNQKNKAAADDL